MGQFLNIRNPKPMPGLTFQPHAMDKYGLLKLGIKSNDHRISIEKNNGDGIHFLLSHS
jgi:hypothetical protein